jgi:hypothetical protein
MKKTLFSVIALTLALSACAVDPKISDRSVLYIDAWVKRNNPQIYVEPLTSPPMPMTAMIIPFEITQDIYYPKELGAQITQVFWQTWTRDRVLPKLIYEPRLRYGNLPQAMAQARKMGLNLLITGRITYLLAGGTTGNSGVSLSVEAFDVNSGERVWSMADAGSVESSMKEDYIIFFRKNRLPTDPLYAIVSVLAADMGGTVINWNYGYRPPEADGASPAEPPNPPAPAPVSGSNLPY